MRTTPLSRLGLSALGLLTLFAPSCDSLGPERSELERARALWEANGPSDYVYTVERLCFCGYRGPARVTVEDGAVVSIVYLADDEPPVELTEELFPTVDGLFDILEDAIARDAHSISATYDPEMGVPVEFFIDYQENVADEELGMRVTEAVTVLGGS
jgi:hypothetical protein